ncbi:multidrug and toxin extrusion protein 2-like isoform X2 [Stegostoma tigrinum]|uniref:multidrug and toxin extrusion protein 2-like isoform X2 n=1 Tax=Stegostoma tigrinum TaxID=3053191 RepID=UPI00286FE90A|nr:multidrug and toxin extrusion protein 2-like isoform X2 [Stegostoma tigrinum]
MGDQEQGSAAGNTSQVWINGGTFLYCIMLVVREEVKQLFLLAGPLILSQVMIYSLNFISSAFSGHLGKYELGAVSLATSVVSVTSVAMGTGLSMACDTLISQTYGSKNLQQIGVILQRGILILLIFCCPCWALFINTEKILLATKQRPEMARLCQLYVKIFIPAVPGITMPQVFTGLVANVLSALMNYIFLIVLKLGVAGSAWANVISQYSQNIILFMYIRWRKLHLQTWGGWTMESLQEWGPFLRLAIPSMFMFCIELWAYEMGSFLAGLISQVELGAQSIIFQVLTVLYMTHVGIGMAAGVRVGMALGGGDPQQAKISAMTAIVCAGCVALFLMTLLLGLKDLIAKVFTSDWQIVDLVSRTIPIVAPVHLSDAIGSGVASGIVRGAGKQKIGAVANLIVFYIVGIPVGISLMFTAKLGILGLWTGLAVGSFLLSSVLLTLIFRMNWTTAAEEAQERTGLRKETGPSAVGLSFDLAEDGSSALSQGQEDPHQLEHTTLIASTLAAGILSPAQLVVRRGLAVVAGLVVLAVGITVHFTV